MNQRKSLYVYIFIGLLCVLNLQAMQDPQTPTKKHFFSVSQRGKLSEDLLSPGMRYISEAWLTLTAKTHDLSVVNTPSRSFIFINFDIITYPLILKELKKAKNAGVQVHIVISPESIKYFKNNNTEIQDALVQLKSHIFIPSKKYTNNHLKLGLWSYIDKENIQEFWSSVGSSNISMHGLFHNNEVNEVTSGSPQSFSKLKDIFDTVYAQSQLYDPEKRAKPFKDDLTKDWFETTIKEVVQQTPSKARYYTSAEYRPWASFAQRFKKLKKDDVVIVSSFTYNDSDFTKKLVELSKQGIEILLFVDKTVLTNKKSSLQLTDLNKAGVKTYVYAGVGSRKIHHAKFGLIDRKSDATKIVYGSTQNISENNKNIELFWMYSNDPESFAQYEKTVQNYISDTVQWSLLKEQCLFGEKRKRE